MKRQGTLVRWEKDRGFGFIRCPDVSADVFVHLRDFSERGTAPQVGMNQPWLTTSDCPVSAFVGNPANSSATRATSSVVVNSPSTVSFSITFLMTSCSVMPSVFACSGICFSTSGVRTKPGQITLARTPCSAPSFATTFARPMSACFAATYGALSFEASFECTEPM